MLVPVSKVLTNYDGSELKDVDRQGNALPVTVKLALVAALAEADPKDTPMHKFEQDALARRIYDTKDGESVALEAKDVVLLKERVGQRYQPVVVGQLWGLLDPKEGSNGGTGPEGTGK